MPPSRPSCRLMTIQPSLEWSYPSSTLHLIPLLTIDSALLRAFLAWLAGGGFEAVVTFLWAVGSECIPRRGLNGAADQPCLAFRSLLSAGNGQGYIGNLLWRMKPHRQIDVQCFGR
jgi:hypothetical protein